MIKDPDGNSIAFAEVTPNAKGQPASSPATKPGPDHRRLDVLVGTWSLAGQQHEGGFGPAAKILAEQTFEWLPGGRRFLIHRLPGHVGDDEMACVEIFEVDARKHEFLLRRSF